jgi:soluble lytic murein transglycosylase-like protein
MNRRTLLTAAFAAGMTSFAADAQESPVALTAVVATTNTAQEPIESTPAPASAPRRVSDRGDFGRFNPAAGADEEIQAGEIDEITTASISKTDRQAGVAESNAKAAETANVPTPQGRAELVATARKASLLTGSDAGATEGDKNFISGAKETAKAKAAAIGAGGKGKYHEIVARYASAYGVPVPLAHAVIAIESNYRPDARGSAGEIGLMQIKPATARMMGFSGSAKELYKPETNIKYGLKYLAKARELGGGSTCGTILKYNAGHGAKRMNPVSAAYCSKVKRRLGSA